MSIDVTYRELLLEQILSEILHEGESPSISEIEDRLTAFLETHDVTKPLFVASDFKLPYGQISSAKVFNQSNQNILRDFKVLYKHLFKITDQAINNHNRWRSEVRLIEGRLINLQERLSSLLLINNDISGFINFFQDNFTDNNKIDLEESSVFINPDKGFVTIGTNSIGATRIDLSSLVDKDVEFNILSRQNLISSVSSTGSKTVYAVTDIENFWQELVYMNKPGPVSIELKINLHGKFELSRIDIDLHTSNQNSSLQITPFTSLDNYNFQQLPIDTFTRSVLDKTSFRFPATEAKFIKLVIVKTGFDQIRDNQYLYEFGIDEVSFYRESFESGVESILISKALSLTNPKDNTIEQFSKLVLQVCEDVPENTKIDYSIAVSNEEDFPVSSGVFVPIDPIDRKTTTKPTTLDFGDLNFVTVNGMQISYDSSDISVGNTFTNPARVFKRIDSVSGTSALTSEIQSSSQRYSFVHSNERILNYSILEALEFLPNTLQLWRNTNTKGDTTLVRGIVRGWGFKDPYYNTSVYVGSNNGVEIDFGSQTIIIDEVALTGKITISTGNHLIQVHKNNWKSIDLSSVTDLISLKSADILYPYNHRYLVEGFSYPDSWLLTEEKIYKGFDIVAEFLMKEVSIFDIINNINIADYSKFSIDLDSLDQAAEIDSIINQTKLPVKVFVVKVNENNPDFINELFLLKFKASNSLFKYLRFKAVLSTDDTDLVPILDSYRIKITN